MLQSNECGEGSPRHCWQEWLYSNETLCLCMCADSNPPAHPLQDLWKSRLYITPSSLSVLLHPLLVVESCPISSRRMDTSTTKNTGTSSFLKGKAQCKLIEINGCRNRMSRIPCTIKIERLGCFSRWKRDTGVLLQRGAVLRGPAIGSPTAVPDRESHAEGICCLILSAYFRGKTEVLQRLSVLAKDWATWVIQRWENESQGPANWNC